MHNGVRLHISYKRSFLFIFFHLYFWSRKLFIEISPTIEIPTQVKREALFEKDSYYAKLIHKLIEEKKIKVIPAENKKAAEIMKEFDLDEGEAAAYVLFDKKRHKALLTDDGELIKLCKLENIEFICVMAIIIRLSELNKIGRYSKELYEHFKNKVI